MFLALRRAETGKWPAWYFGECLAGLEENRDIVRVLLAELRGEPAPPQHVKRGYDDIYRYQDSFKANFPRLYPHPETTKP